MTQKKIFKWEWGTLPAAQISEPVQNAAKRITERTNGELNVELYGRDFVPEKEIFSAVGSGKLDMAFTWSGTAGPGVLHHCDVGQLPIWPSGIAGCMFTKALVDKYFRSEMEALGFTPIVYEMNCAHDFGFFTANYHVQIWSKKMFTSLKDAEGARVSAQVGMSGEALASIGMAPTVMPYAGIIPALSENSVDAALLPAPGPMFFKLDDVTPYCLRIDYPEGNDDCTIMNTKTYNSLPSDIRNIVIEEVKRLMMDPRMDRSAMSERAREYNNALVTAGKLKIIELTPNEKAWCKKQWETELVDIWIKNAIAAGLKDAKAYLDDVLKIRDSILASGLPQYPGALA